MIAPHNSRTRVLVEVESPNLVSDRERGLRVPCFATWKSTCTAIARAHLTGTLLRPNSSLTLLGVGSFLKRR